MRKVYRRHPSLPLAVLCLSVGALICCQAYSQQPPAIFKGSAQAATPRLLSDGAADKPRLVLDAFPLQAERADRPEEGGSRLRLVQDEQTAGDAPVWLSQSQPRFAEPALPRTAARKSTVPAPAAQPPGPMETPPGVPQATPPYRASIGMQTASLSVDWVTPESILIGQEGLFELVVRNQGRVAVEQITIEDVLPAGFRMVKAAPEPANKGANPVWRMNRLEPQEEIRIALRLIPEKIGNIESRAKVNFGTSSTAAFRVVEPKLELEVDTPENVIVGSQVVFHVTVKNPGSGRTTNAVITVETPENLVISQNPVFKVGALNPGESRSIRVLAKATGLGRHTATFTATADHGLRDSATRQVTGLGAKLDLTIDGPAFRYISRPATYTVRLKNTGTAPAHNVHLLARVPKAFAWVEAEANGRFDSTNKSISWFVGAMEVGQEFEATFTLRAESAGELPILAEAEAERGVRAEAQRTTRVEGIAALLLEVVDIEDPVEVGAETLYEILVVNQGTAFADNLKITGIGGDGMQIVDGQGPTKGHIDGNTIRFAPLPKLAPRADAIYRVKVRFSKPGDARIEVRAEIDSLNTPVTELESTQIYQD